MVGERSCNVCDDEIERLLLGGALDAVTIAAHDDGALACPNEDCRARPRTKTFRLFYDQHVRPALTGEREKRRVLEIAGIGATRRIIAPDHLGGYVNAALFGRAVTTDLRDLKEFADRSFELVTACEVLDYILELDRVFASVRRVLSAGGLFVFHIDQDRLIAGDDSPVATAWLELGGYYPDDYRLPSVRVGEQWLLAHAEAAGLSTDLLDYTDVFSGYRAAWFLARKPV